MTHKLKDIRGSMTSDVKGLWQDEVKTYFNFDQLLYKILSNAWLQIVKGLKWKKWRK
jgi:hypothetical protein